MHGSSEKCIINYMNEKLVREKLGLAPSEIEKLREIDRTVGDFAKLTQSDIFVDCFISDKEGIVISHGRPEKSLYKRNIEGEKVLRPKEPTVFYTRETGVGMKDAFGISQENVRVQQRTSPIFGDDGRIIAVFIQESDVTDSARLSSKLSRMANLTEKLSSQGLINEGVCDINSETRDYNILLQETHHRIKNNLQTISSILNMQRRRSENPETREILSDNISRINSLASMHEIMMTAAGEEVEMQEALEKQIRLFEHIHGDSKRQISFDFEGMPLALSFEKAQALSMIVNELMVNAIKHGFKNRDKGIVSVRLVVGENQATVIVFNDGEARSEKPERTEGNSGIGLSIVRGLAQGKLGGTYSLQSSPGGTTAMVGFPLET